MAAVVLAGVGGAVIAPMLDTEGGAGEPGAGGAPAVDGLPWSAVKWRQPAAPFPPGPAAPLRVDGFETGHGLVVGWGRVAAVGRNQFNDMGAAFVSADGERWAVNAVVDGVGVDDTSELHGMAAGRGGALAYGGVCCSVEERAVWRSIDGVTWTRARLDLEPGWAFNRVIANGDGWVAVGTAAGETAVWTSSDGASWRPGVLEGSGRGIIADVVVHEGGLLAVGTLDDAAGTHDGAVWASPDGTTWSRVAAADPTLIGPDEVELVRLVRFAGGLFVVGRQGPHEDRVRCEQMAGRVATTGGGAPLIGRSCGWGLEHHWLSADGEAWVRLPSLEPLPGQPRAAGERPIEFRLVAAGGPGLVVVGEDTRPPDGDTAVWVSGDGRTWRPVPSLGLRPQAGIAAAVPLGRRVIVAEQLVAANAAVRVLVGEVSN